MTVLFTSGRPFEDADNIRAVWDAYDGGKRFEQLGYTPGNPDAYPECKVVVSDEFVRSKAPHQKLVMIAHGLTGGKKYGADQQQGQFSRESCSLVDYYVVSSEFGIPFAASAAGIEEERCLPLGMPRTDCYAGLAKGDGGTVLAKFPRTYLYVPTFRSRYNDPMPPLNFAEMDEMMEPDELLVVRRHRNMPGPMLHNRYEHVMEVDSSGPPLPYLADCDVVLTDYSSILFDGYMLGKPCVLLAEDMESYLSTRGMYMDYPWDYCSRHVRDNGDADAVLAQLRAACATGMRGVERKCLERVAGSCDGHASERVARFVKLLEDGENPRSMTIRFRR